MTCYTLHLTYYLDIQTCLYSILKQRVSNAFDDDAFQALTSPYSTCTPMQMTYRTLKPQHPNIETIETNITQAQCHKLPANLHQLAFAKLDSLGKNKGETPHLTSIPVSRELRPLSAMTSLPNCGTISISTPGTRQLTFTPEHFT